VSHTQERLVSPISSETGSCCDNQGTYVHVWGGSVGTGRVQSNLWRITQKRFFVQVIGPYVSLDTQQTKKYEWQESTLDLGAVSWYQGWFPRTVMSYLTRVVPSYRHEYQESTLKLRSYSLNLFLLWEWIHVSINQIQVSWSSFIILVQSGLLSVSDTGVFHRYYLLQQGPQDCLYNLQPTTGSVFFPVVVFPVLGSMWHSTSYDSYLR
jgi:hypothetical protein